MSRGEGEALECHEGLIYLALHKLTNGRLFLGVITGYDSEGGGGGNFKANETTRRMHDALMRHSFV